MMTSVPLASVADTFWAIVALVGGVGAVAFMLWIASRGTPERDDEDAARTFFDAHGHWPDEDPPVPTTRIDEPTALLRAGSIDAVRASLVTTLTEGEEEWLLDERDLMMELAPHHHLVRRLGYDAGTLFAAAAEEGPEALREAVVRFGLRHDVSPHAFGFLIVDEAEGPAYYRTD